MSKTLPYLRNKKYLQDKEILIKSTIITLYYSIIFNEYILVYQDLITQD